MPTQHPKVVIMRCGWRWGERLLGISFFFAGPWGRTRGTALCPSPPRRGLVFPAPNLSFVWVDRRMGWGVLATTLLVRNSGARRKLFPFYEKGN